MFCSFFCCLFVLVFSCFLGCLSSCAYCVDFSCSFFYVYFVVFSCFRSSMLSGAWFGGIVSGLGTAFFGGGLLSRGLVGGLLCVPFFIFVSRLEFALGFAGCF